MFCCICNYSAFRRYDHLSVKCLAERRTSMPDPRSLLCHDAPPSGVLCLLYIWQRPPVLKHPPPNKHWDFMVVIHVLVFLPRPEQGPATGGWNPITAVGVVVWVSKYFWIQFGVECNALVPPIEDNPVRTTSVYHFVRTLVIWFDLYSECNVFVTRVSYGVIS